MAAQPATPATPAAPAAAEAATVEAVICAITGDAPWIMSTVYVGRDGLNEILAVVIRQTLYPGGDSGLAAAIDHLMCKRPDLTGGLPPARVDAWTGMLPQPNYTLWTPDDAARPNPTLAQFHFTNLRRAIDANAPRKVLTVLMLHGCRWEDLVTVLQGRENLPAVEHQTTSNIIHYMASWDSSWVNLAPGLKAIYTTTPPTPYH
jgi:hypothetical protein